MFGCEVLCCIGLYHNVFSYVCVLPCVVLNIGAGFGFVLGCIALLCCIALNGIVLYVVILSGIVKFCVALISCVVMCHVVSDCHELLCLLLHWV